jgi:hypothetical protein
MAINKICTNRKVIVKNNYSLIVGGELIKIANQFKIVSTKENLTLCSAKKIQIIGNKS